MNELIVDYDLTNNGNLTIKYDSGNIEIYNISKSNVCKLKKELDTIVNLYNMMMKKVKFFGYSFISLISGILLCTLIGFICKGNFLCNEFIITLVTTTSISTILAIIGMKAEQMYNSLIDLQGKMTKEINEENIKEEVNKFTKEVSNEKRKIKINPMNNELSPNIVMKRIKKID